MLKRPRRSARWFPGLAALALAVAGFLLVPSAYDFLARRQANRIRQISTTLESAHASREEVRRALGAPTSSSVDFWTYELPKPWRARESGSGERLAIRFSADSDEVSHIGLIVYCSFKQNPGSRMDPPHNPQQVDFTLVPSPPAPPDD
jgi:hypothetical protein